MTFCFCVERAGLVCNCFGQKACGTNFKGQRGQINSQFLLSEFVVA